MAKYEIGFGPLNGPGESGGGLGAGPGTPILFPGETIDAPRPTSASMVIKNLAITAKPYLGPRQRLEAHATVTWDAPDQGESDTDVNQVRSYEVKYSIGDGYGPTSGVRERTVQIFGLPVLRLLVVQVRAKAGSGFFGPWATASIVTPDTTVAPPVPTPPTIYGTIRGGAAGWDGKFAGGVEPPDNFQVVEIQLALNDQFNGGVIAGRLPGAGYTAVVELGRAPFTVYGRSRSVNTSGVASAWSATSQGGSIPIVPEDVGQKAITTQKLADAAVNADKILNGAIEALKLGTGAVTTRSLSDLAITVDKVADGAMTARKTALAAIDPNSGTLAIDSVAANHITAGAINAGHIVTDAIVARHIVAGAITTSELAADSVTAAKIAALTITADELAANSVQAGKIAANAISSGVIQAGAIFSDHISTESIVGKTLIGGKIATNYAGNDRIELVGASSLHDALRWYAASGSGLPNDLVGEIRGYMGDIGQYGIFINSTVQIGNLQSVIYQVGRRVVGHSASRVRAGVSSITTSAGGSAKVAFNPNFPEGAVPRVTAIGHFAGENAVVLEIGSIAHDGFHVAFGGGVDGNGNIKHIAATRNVSWIAEWFI